VCVWTQLFILVLYAKEGAKAPSFVVPEKSLKKCQKNLKKVLTDVPRPWYNKSSVEAKHSR
jgi:hypothetical protein